MFSSIINNSIKQKSFVYAQSNKQTVLFQIIQFIIIHLFENKLYVKEIFLAHI